MVVVSLRRELKEVSDASTSRPRWLDSVTGHVLDQRRAGRVAQLSTLFVEQLDESHPAAIATGLA